MKGLALRDSVSEDDLPAPLEELCDRWRINWQENADEYRSRGMHARAYQVEQYNTPRVSSYFIFCDTREGHDYWIKVNKLCRVTEYDI